MSKSWSMLPVFGLLTVLAGCGVATTAQPTSPPRPETRAVPTSLPTSIQQVSAGTILFSGPDALYALRPDGSGKRPLTAPGYTVSSFAISPDRSQVAFCSDQAIYLLKMDGTGLSRLSPASVSDCEPAWSPSGARIAFLRAVSGGSQVIYTVRPDGSDETLVAEAESFLWSPDGKRIALLTHRASGQATIRVVNADGTDEHIVFEGPLAVIWTGFSWSPDSSRIVLNALDVETYVVAADGSEQLDIGRGEGPAWSPDGQRIALSQRQWTEDGEITSWAVLTMNVDGTVPVKLLGPEQMPEDVDYCGRPLWSPDGQQLLVSCLGKAGRSGVSLWAVAVDGSTRNLVVEETGCIYTWTWIEEALPGAVALLPLPTPQPTVAPPVAWAIEAVDEPRQFMHMGSHSLRLDAQGLPHIAYGGNHLYYAWHGGTTWHMETVDGAVGVGMHASLALDSAGRPHVSYYDNLNYDLKYAHYDGSAWQIETVDSAGFVGEHTSLALDAAGYPHISYLDHSGNGLKYAYYDGTAWQIETVDQEGRVGYYTALVLDSAGQPHISYGCFGEGATDQLRYAYHDGSGWHVEIVDSSLGRLFGHTSLMLDAAGRPHIAYYDGEAFELRYASYDGSAWQFEVVATGGQYGGDASLALDAVGQPGVSYYDQENDALKYARREGAGWRSDVVEQGLGYWADSTALALDDAGRPHISYSTYDEYSGVGIDLKYARYDGMAWQVEVVDQGGDLCGSTSLALDAAGRPHIGYANSLGHDLKYAAYDGTTWQIETVAGVERVGVDVSLALDGAALPHMSYYSYTSVVRGLVNSDLMYAHYDGSSWRVEVVDRGEVGYDNSIAVDAAGRPHITYFDQDHYSLKYARFDGSAWQIETVDNAGGWSSLALDDRGQPHIAYYDQRNDHLKYARRDGGGWQIQVADDAKGSGWYISLALDTAGHPHISYTDRESGALKYADYDGEQWTVQWVGGKGRTTSLALDRLGRPHISCSLLHIYDDGSGWQFEPVDREGAPGDYNSLVIDTAGLVHISYYDWRTGAVRYAHQVRGALP